MVELKKYLNENIDIIKKYFDIDESDEEYDFDEFYNKLTDLAPEEDVPVIHNTEDVWNFYKCRDTGGYSRGYATMYNLTDFNKEDLTGYVVIVESDEKYFTDKEKAIEYCKSFKAYETIEEEIDELMRMSSYKEGLNIEVDACYNNGNFYDFKVYYYEDLILDGTSYLSVNEIDKYIKDIEDIKKCLNEKGVYLDFIRKTKDGVGFNRYYEIGISNSEKSIEREIQISQLLQGQKKVVSEIIEDELDELIKDLNEID